jgi:hypothetical protein
MANMDVSVPQVTEIRRLAKSKGIDKVTFQERGLDGPNAVLKVALEALRQGRTVRIGKRIPVYDPSTGIYRFDVDFGESLATMVEEGHYDWTNPDVTPERFLITERGLVEFEGKLFDFGTVSSDAAEEGIRVFDTERPWAPAPIAPLLGFGAAFPDVQRKNPVEGLGSVARVDGSRLVPCLGRSGAKRYLYLYVRGGVWNGFYRFLGVRPALAQASS